MLDTQHSLLLGRLRQELGQGNTTVLREISLWKGTLTLLLFIDGGHHKGGDSIVTDPSDLLEIGIDLVQTQDLSVELPF